MKQQLTEAESEVVENLLGSAYYNIFVNILSGVMKDHPMVKIAQMQMKDALKLLDIEPLE